MSAKFIASPVLAAFLLAAAACSTAPKPSESEKSMSQRPFGKLPTGEEITAYALTNANKMQATVINYGARVVSLTAPDANGQLADVVTGFDSLDGYLQTNPYFGAVVGRYGNRIAKGKFTIDGHEYTLAVNNGANALHGGLKGFDKVAWAAKPIQSPDGPGLELKYTSKDGEEGYPGTLDTTVTYVLTNSNELRISYLATTDKDTVLNLTNHTYFNLAGQSEGDILDHEITINADRFTPVDAGLIPTGELRPVEGTPFDFRKPAAIGARINADEEQIKLGGGYDHNFVLNRTGDGLSLAARVRDPKSGRVMEVLTAEPGVQFYTGNFLDGTVKGKGGRVYTKRAAFCLETQHFPDSPNKPSFPSVLLKPGSKYQTATVYRFSAEQGK